MPAPTLRPIQPRDDLPQFSRKSGTVELRGECPREVVDMLDALSMAADVTRTALINEILKAHTDKEKHKAMLIYRVAMGNPELPEGSGASEN